MERGTVYIFPDENEILEDCFVKKINKSHLEAMREFSHKYKLNYDFKDGDYQEAPCTLVRDGNLLIKTIDEIKHAICYIPNKVTDRQSIMFHTILQQLQTFDYIGAFIEDENKGFYKEENLTKITKIVNKNNIAYTKATKKSK